MIPNFDRRELLKQTRQTLSGFCCHTRRSPRYGHIYHELYDTPDSGEGEHHSGSFFARLMLAVFLFLSFVYIEQNHLKPADISSTQIVNEIQKEIPGNGMDFISRIKLY